MNPLNAHAFKFSFLPRTYIVYEQLYWWKYSYTGENDISIIQDELKHFYRYTKEISRQTSIIEKDAFRASMYLI